MNSKWLAIWPEAPVTATRTVFCQLSVRDGSSCADQQPNSSACSAEQGHHAQLKGTAGNSAAAHIGGVVRKPENTIFLQLLMFSCGRAGCGGYSGCGRLQ